MLSPKRAAQCGYQSVRSFITSNRNANDYHDSIVDAIEDRRGPRGRDDDLNTSTSTRPHSKLVCAGGGHRRPSDSPVARAVGWCLAS